VKPVSNALLTLLASRQFFAADLYTFSGGNLGSTILRYCGGDANITSNGFLFTAGGQTGPYFDRQDNKAKCHWKVGVEVDTLVLDMIPGTAQVAGAQMQQAIRSGLFDGAELMLEKAFMPTYGDVSRGTVVYFVGRVADIDAGRSVCTFTINSHLELLNITIPRNLCQPGCMNALGDASCQASIPSTPGTLVGGQSIGGLNANLTSTSATGAYNLGTITFTSGVLNGLSFGVGGVTNAGNPVSIYPQGVLPSSPSSGDTFTLSYGCDKSLGSNGCPKFSNQARFRGFPFVPQPSVAV
jgi:uncharacterized phage protein (TIGR02218 family)